MGWEGPITHRQYLVWIEWLDMQYDYPSRADYYEMQTAAEVCRMRVGKKASTIKLESMRIRFRNGEEKRLSKEEVTRLSKQRWLGIVENGESGMKAIRRVKLIDKEE
jgi:hypothetical protein